MLAVNRIGAESADMNWQRTVRVGRGGSGGFLAELTRCNERGSDICVSVNPVDPRLRDGSVSEVRRL